MTDVATTTQREPASAGWRRMTRAVARRWPTGATRLDSWDRRDGRDI